LLVVEQNARESQARDRAYLVALRVLDHPLKLCAGGLEIPGLEKDLGRDERGERRVGAARVVLENRARGLACRLEVVGAGRLLERVVERGGLRRLRALVPGPAVPGRDRGRDEDRGEADSAPMLLPPGLERGELLLFLEIVGAHACPLS